MDTRGGSAFGVLLRHHRELAALTQEELAERSGLSVRAIRDLERGHTRRPYRQSIELLAEALGLDDTGQANLMRAGRGGGVRPASADGGVNRVGPSVAGLVIPRQLPAPSRFVARAAELEALTTLVDQTESGTVLISAIVGPGGVGKTALAVYWAHQHLGRFPDGQLFVDLQGFAPADPLDPARAIRGFLDALGADSRGIPIDVQAQAARYRSLVAGKRMLIVLDNARDAGQVIPLLPGSPSCTVLVTSRDRLTGLITTHGARPVPVDVLAGDEARNLLAARLGAERLAAEPDVANELVDRCAGHPLALNVVVGRVLAHPDFPLATLAAELAEATGRLAAFDDACATASVPTVLSWSYHALPPYQQRLFTLLGIVPGPDISGAAAATLAGEPEEPGEHTESALRGLEHASLVQQRQSGRYRMHDLIRLYAINQASHHITNDERQTALRRLTDFYLHTALTGDRLLDPSGERCETSKPGPGCRPWPLRDRTEALAWFDSEYACLRAFLSSLGKLGLHRQTWQLACTLHTYHKRRGRLTDNLEVWQVALTAAGRLDELAMQTRAHRELGDAHARLGHHTRALRHLHQAMALAEHTGDATSQALVHQAFAWAWEAHGDYSQARKHVTFVLRHYETHREPTRHAHALADLAWYCTNLEDYQQGRVHGEAALAFCRNQAHSGIGEAAVLDTLGVIAHRTGELALAVEYHHDALALRRYELHDTYREANSLDHLGDVHVALGQHFQARQTWQQALELFRTQHRTTDADQTQRKLGELDQRSTT